MTGCPVVLSQENFIHRAVTDRSWRSFAVDSRRVKPGMVFFALPGKQTDGHYYIPAALEAGAKAVVLHEPYFHSHAQSYAAEAGGSNSTFVPVRDSLVCLQEAGKQVFAQSRAQKIGITGSNGKTSTKDLLACVLLVAGPVHYAEGNLNSDIGLPLVLAAIPDNTDYAVLEMAMSEVGEMKTLAEIVSPQYALLTNIGTAHIGNIGSVEAISEEKFQIFSNMKADNVAILPAVDTAARRYLAGHSLKCRVIFYGLTETYGFSLISENRDGSEFEYGGERYQLPCWGMHLLHNAAGVITLSKVLGLSCEQINRGFSSFRVPRGRGNIIRQESILIDDSYNASPASMKAAFAVAQTVAQTAVDRAVGRGEERRLIFVLGDMKELGSESLAAHKDVMTAALLVQPYALLLLGEEFAVAAADGYGPADLACVHIFSDLAELRDGLQRHGRAGDVFLVKASRSMELERIIADVPGLGVENKE